MKTKFCAICRATFRPNKNARTADTRTLCLKCRKAGRFAQTLADPYL